MTLFYYDPRFTLHQTGEHPECPQRVIAVAQHLERMGLADRLTRPTWQPLSSAQLAHTHAPGYLAELERVATGGGGYLDPDTVCSRDSFQAAALAAGAVTDAVDRVLAGQAERAFCLVRPPGHHALADRAMGFCLLANVAIGARAALDQHGLARVMIVDWDVHHGNGTQAIVWEEPRAGFLSIHRWPFYPGTGWHDETGGGRALGTKVNLPVEFGTSRQHYFDAFRRGLEHLADRIRPELILVSAGFDAHRDDPIGSLGLEADDFGLLTQWVLDVAQVHAQGRVVSVLEGGYNLEALAESAAIHVRRLISTA